MNMMSWQERREEQAVPDFVRQLRSESAQDEDNEAAPAAGAERTTLLERFAWFRNLPLARKINAIFGTFLGVGLLMALVLGLGLGELWQRYTTSARLQEALVMAGQIEAGAGELRHDSLRALYQRSAALDAAQRRSESALAARLAALETKLGSDAPEFAPRVAALREGLATFQARYDEAREAARSGDAPGRAADSMAEAGRALITASAGLSAALSADAEAL
ncbi:MAG: hypothetical protein ACK4MR_12690, partial [Erythrobacter cryptus]